MQAFDALQRAVDGRLNMFHNPNTRREPLAHALAEIWGPSGVGLAWTKLLVTYSRIESGVSNGFRLMVCGMDVRMTLRQACWSLP